MSVTVICVTAELVNQCFIRLVGSDLIKYQEAVSSIVGAQEIFINE